MQKNIHAMQGLINMLQIITHIDLEPGEVH